MTEREFLRRLGKYKGKFRVCRFSRSGRSAVRCGEKCPLEMVVGTGRRTHERAANLLGIDADLRYDIVVAADYYELTAMRHRALRAKMLRVLGLKERA